MVECLKSLEGDFSISEYTYVGMGSFWFIDFVLVHRSLSINEMYSIEYVDNQERAEYNRPYNCITVIGGETTEALDILDLKDRRSIIWLDYTQGLNGPVMKDMKIVCSSAKSGTILMITLYAGYNQISYSGSPEGIAAAEKRLKRLVGTLAPPSLRGHVGDGPFSSLLGRIVFENGRSLMNESGRREEFIPLFNFFYQDGAPMITVAGMIADENDRNTLLGTRNLKQRCHYFTGEEQFGIDVPPLTRKEKAELDRLLPADALTQEKMEELTGFSLEQEQLDAYRHFYVYYPVFAELHNT
jgi:hypothetical protein